MTRPGFFIVGAPKCGTTSLARYIAQHPHVYMCPLKEPFYFGSDVSGGSAWSLEQYLAMFERAGDRVCGEATTWYLYSKTAAGEIRSFNPDARIIIMLRNPVEAARSLHNQALFNEDEEIADFDAALSAEVRRRSGRDMPRRCRAPYTLRYTDTYMFSEQVARYLRVFPPEHILTVIFDDMRADGGAEVARVFRHLGVDPGFSPTLGVHNRSRRARSRWVQRLIRHRRAQQVARLLVPPALRPAVASLAMRLNSRNVALPPLHPRVHARLCEAFAPDIERLGAMLGRDLSHWCRPGRAPGPPGA